MLLHLWFFFNLICNRTMFWTSWILTYWPQGLGGRGGGGVCRQNICYHFAALVIYLNLMCNMFMFWKSCILTLRPPVLAGGGGGGGSAGKIFPIMLLHVWFLLIWYATWPYSEEVEFWALDPNHLSPPRGSDRCLWSKITFDMFHNYFTSVCMRQFSKNVDNWLSYCKI